jgi:hypothetical protein
LTEKARKAHGWLKKHYPEIVNFLNTKSGRIVFACVLSGVGVSIILICWSCRQVFEPFPLDLVEFDGYLTHKKAQVKFSHCMCITGIKALFNTVHAVHASWG